MTLHLSANDVQSPNRPRSALSSSLGSPNSSSPGSSPKKSASPSSKKVRARNDIAEYTSDIRSLLHMMQTARQGSSDDISHTNKLPALQFSAIDDTLLSVEEWLDDGIEDASVDDSKIYDVLSQLQTEMDACGVSLYREVAGADARKKYHAALSSLMEWLIKTRWKTNEEQPLQEFERNIILDFAEVEKLWAERENNICAPWKEFVDRTRCITELRNADYEQRQQNEQICGILATLGDGKLQRFKQLVKHVANRATILRHTPRDNLSIRQRRDTKMIATSVLEWLDKNGDTATTEQLFAQLSRVNETALSVSAAADIVARRNDLEQLLDYIKSSISLKPDVMEALGEDNIEGLWFVLDKAGVWLEEHQNPSIQTLEKFLESLRLAASRYGLSCFMTTASNGDSKLVIPKDGEGGGSKKPGSAPGGMPKLLALDIACAMVEQLQVLRVACAAAGVQSFVSQRIAPLQLEVSDLLSPDAEGDGAAVILRHYKAVLKLVQAEAGIRTPSSCWSQVLQLEEAVFDD